MKKTNKTHLLFTFLMAFALSSLLSSCKTEDENTSFVGDWGVQKIEYYSTDYEGNPIAETIETFEFIPGGDEGIEMIFKADKTGTIIDKELDTIKPFTYSYDEDESILYVSLTQQAYTYRMFIENKTDNAFTYINRYESNYVEKASLVKIGDAKVNGKNKFTNFINKPGSLLGDR